MSDAPNPWAVVSQQPLAPSPAADPWAVVSQQPAASPQWTRQSPFVPPSGHTQEEADSFFGLPPGSVVKTPQGLRVVPTPPPEQQGIDPTTGTPVDWSRYEAPQEPGWIGTGIEAAGKGIAQGFTDLMRAPSAFRARPPEAPDTSPTGERIAQSFSAGWQDPKWWIANIMHGAGGSSPAIVGGIGGALAGLPFGGVGAIPGALIGGVAGYGLTAAMQTLAPAYQHARAQGLTHDDAVTRAMIESGISGVFNAAAAAMPAIGVTGRTAEGALKRPISEALAQIFGVQPAIGVGEEVTKGLATGDMPSWDDLAKTAVIEAGAGALLESAQPAYEAARRRRAAQLAQQQAGAEPTAPPEDAPPFDLKQGDVLEFALGDGTVRMPVERVEGDRVYVRDPDGNVVPMALGDLAEMASRGFATKAPEIRFLPPPETIYGDGFTVGAPPVERDPTVFERPPVPRGTAAPNESGAPAEPPEPRTRLEIAEPEAPREQEAPAPRPAPPVAPVETPPAPKASDEDLSAALDSAMGEAFPEEAAPAPAVQAPAPPAPVERAPEIGQAAPETGRAVEPESDTAKWLRDREERVAASKAAGNTHLDQPPRYVETLRGKEIYNVHDPAERGVVRSVANTGEVVVIWNDEHSRQKNKIGLQDIVQQHPQRGKPDRVIGKGSWLHPHELEDYVIGSPDQTKTPVPPPSSLSELSDQELQQLIRGIEQSRGAESARFENGVTVSRDEALAELARRAPPPAPEDAPAGNTPVVTDETHTKTGKPIHFVRFPQKPGIEGLGPQARKMGGQWSSFRGGGMQPGWLFRDRAKADQFAEWARQQMGEAPSKGAEAPTSTPQAPAAPPSDLPADLALAPRWMKENTTYGRQQLAVAAGFSPKEAERISKMGWFALEREPQIVARMEAAWQRGQIGEAPAETPAGEAQTPPTPATPRAARPDVWGRYVDDYGSPQVDSGERLRTASGRITDPAPKFTITDGKSAMRAFRRVDAWLVDQAKKEVAATGSNAARFVNRMDPKNFSPADRDLAHEVLWGADRPTERNRIAPDDAAPPPPGAERWGDALVKVYEQRGLGAATTFLDGILKQSDVPASAEEALRARLRAALTPEDYALTRPIGEEPAETPAGAPAPQERPRAPVDDWADAIVKAYRDGADAGGPLTGAEAAVAMRDRIIAEHKANVGVSVVLGDRLRKLFTPDEAKFIRDWQNAQPQRFETPPAGENPPPPAEAPVGERPMDIEAFASALERTGAARRNGLWRIVPSTIGGAYEVEYTNTAHRRVTYRGDSTIDGDGEPWSLEEARGAAVDAAFPREAAKRRAESVPAEAPPVPRGTAPAPTSQTDVEMGHAIVRARRETEEEPTEGQKEAGNYRKGRVNFHGLPFVLENPQGSIRRGVGRDGEAWEVELPADYGYISRTDGADGDQVDAYLGPDLLSDRAWVIDQVDADTGRFDEHKILMGFADWNAARTAYLDAFSDDRGEARIGAVTPMSLDQLKGWLKEGDTHSPVGQQTLPLDRVAPTSPVEPTAREAENGVQGTLRPGDARPRPEDAAGSREARPPQPAPSGDERPGAPDAAGVAGAVPRADDGAEARGGGDRAGDADRVPAGDERPGEGGATGRPAERAVAEIRGDNFVIEQGALEEGRSPRQKARDNLAAIELAKALVAERRVATREEQATLAKYVGWGGLANAFPDPNTGQFKKEFEQIGPRLKEVLTPEEYRTAQRSTQYAHYTSEPVIRSMWNAVERLGFKGGSVFEPGMGVGHFLGMMPPEVAQASKYQGLELDHVTAMIAKLLYPQSGVRRADMMRTPIPPDTFDLAIGNPPFGDITIRSDPKYAARGFLLHDYFFAKSIDSVRPGGLLAFVTSAGTMNKLDDAARLYMAERAEFVGGVRLPSSAFAKNAGTEVTADILFFKKRPAKVAFEPGQAPKWTETVVRSLPDVRGTPTEGNVNRYFAEHPEMVLGEEGFFDKLYKGRYAVHARAGDDMPSLLRAAFDRLPENVMEPPLSPEQKAALDFSTQETKEGSYYIADDGRLMQYSSGAGHPVARRGAGVEGGKTAVEIETIRHLLPIRDALRDVFRADLANDSTAGSAARQRLNRFYDAFVKANGPLNKAIISTRRPNVIQQESARSEAREEARELGQEWHEGEFDAAPMLAAKASVAQIARARQEARARAAAQGREFDEGTFDPVDMPDIVIVKRPNIDPFEEDQESYRLRAIEEYDDATGAHQKRRIFHESILTREEEPQINSAGDGIMWSVNKFGRLDVDAIAALIGKDRQAVIEELGDRIMRLPGTEEMFEIRDQYLSGDVVAKLAEAKEAAKTDPRFLPNVAALEAAQPPPLSPAEIQVNLGMPWVPTATIEEFVQSLDIGRANVRYSPQLGRWIIGIERRGANFDTWGTDDMDAGDILAHALNRIPAVVRRTDRGPPQITYVDEDATQAAQDKVGEVKRAFQDWIAADPERADQLADVYNRNFNRVVLRQWDGSHLTTPGVSKEWSWRPHQTRVVARIVQDGNTYMAHAVGAGKTSAMIGAAMEMRRLGLVHKPMIVVPNHMLGQFAKEFYEQYPTAKIRVADERNFHTSRRKQFVADIAQQDLDAVIITNSAFKKIPISREFGDQIIQEHVDEIDDALSDLGQNPGDLKRVSRDVAPEDRVTVKQLQKRKEKLQERLAGRGGEQDAVNTFEELGVDFLFVDEAHQFRKLSFVTQTPMKGITSQGSDMAWDLYTKIRYLDQLRPGRSLVLASGTPVTNTMGELYTLSRYMQPGTLKESGLAHFDSWAQSFGDIKAELEQTAQGTYESVTRFSEFVNIPELYKMVGQVMDVVTPTELGQYVVRPQLKGGQRQFHLAPRTPWLAAYQQTLADRVRAIKARRGPPSKGDDILLSVINDGRAAAIDPRLVDPSLPNDPDSKLNQMIDNLFRIWKETANTRFADPATNYEREVMRGPATQLVFANFGIPSKKADGRPAFSAYQWIRRELIRRGVPAAEIAFIKDATTAVAKQRLFNDVNDGKVRILIGSTAKMGTGVNVQKRLKAIHNLDPLWYPADDEQRNGRGIRQGNLNPEIEIHDYSTQGTYDSTMWQMMGRKGRFIEQFFRGDPTLRTMEDLGEASVYEQASAMSTADPRVIELTELRQELQTLERRARAHENEQYSLRSRVRGYERDAEQHERAMKGLDLAIGRATPPGKFEITLYDAQGKATRHTDRTKAGEAIEKTLAGWREAMTAGDKRLLGRFDGFDLTADAYSWGERDENGRLKVDHQLRLTLWKPEEADGANGDVRVSWNKSGAGTIASAAGLVRDLPHERAAAEQGHAQALERAAANRAQIGKEFADRAKIRPLREQIARLEAALSAKETGTGAEAEVPTGTPGPRTTLDDSGTMVSRLLRDESGSGPNPFGPRGSSEPAEEGRGPRSIEELIARGREAEARAKAGGAGGNPPPPRGPTPAAPGPDDDPSAALNRIMHTDDRGPVQRLKDFLNEKKEDFWLKARQSVLDDLAGLEAALKKNSPAAWSAYKSLPLNLSRLTRNHDSVLAAVVGLRQGDGFAGGAIRWNAGEGAFEIAPGSKPFMEIFKPIFDAGLQDQWALWAIVNRAKRLMAEGREHNVSQADIDQYADLDQKYLAPDGRNLFRQTMNEWRALNKATLDLAEATGLVNAEQRAEWENDDYVPFFRAIDDDKVVAPGRGKRGVANQRSGIHRLEGSDERVANLYENMVRNLGSIIDRSMKNQAMREIVGELSGTEALTPLSKLARQQLDTPEAQAHLVAMGLDPDAMTEAAKAAAASLYGARKRGDDNLVSVMEDGRIQYYRVEDPLLLRSLVALGPQIDVAMPILRLAKNVLTSAVTIDPGFMMRNLLRDTVHSKVVTGSKFTPGIDTAKGFVKSLRNDPSAVALMAGGAGGGHFYKTAPDKVRRAMERKDFKDSVLDSPLKLWRALEHIGRASEQANRIAIYERAIAEGATKSEALAQAQDLLNYSMRGDHRAMRFLIETVPFMNARIQGLYRLYRGARDNPKSFLLRGGMLMGAAIALWAANQDDERYKALDDWEKQNYFNFFVGGQHFRLPMPFEVGVIFAVIPEMLLNYDKTGRGRELAKTFGSTLEHQLSLNPLPQLVRPLYDLYANKAAFTGKPIISRSEERLIAPEQHGPQASQMMVELGHAIGVSPDWAQYLVTGYGGTVATYLLAAADAAAAAAGATPERASKRLDQMPIVSSFVREEPALSTRWLTEFYDLKREVDQLYNTLRKYQKIGNAEGAQKLVASEGKKIALHKPMTDLSERLGLIRDGMAAVEANKKMPPAEKRRELDALLKQRNEAVKAVRPMLREVEGLRATP